MARIKLKYVNGFSNRDRKSQRVRYYFRRRGIKAIPLPGVPGCEEFMAAYSAALASVPDEYLEIGANRTLPGTINALIVMYYRSDEWDALADETKKTRRRIIERFRAQHGEKRVALLQREHIMKMLAVIQKPSAKRSWLKTIRGLMRAAVPTMRKDDPTDTIPGIKLPRSKGHHTWNDDEIAQYRAHWPLGTQQRLVMEFALETASRRGEVVRLGPQHVKDGRIRIPCPVKRRSSRRITIAWRASKGYRRRPIARATNLLARPGPTLRGVNRHGLRVVATRNIDMETTKGPSCPSKVFRFKKCWL